MDLYILILYSGLKCINHFLMTRFFIVEISLHLEFRLGVIPSHFSSSDILVEMKVVKVSLKKRGSLLVKNWYYLTFCQCQQFSFYGLQDCDSGNEVLLENPFKNISVIDVMEIYCYCSVVKSFLFFAILLLIVG